MRVVAAQRVPRVWSCDSRRKAPYGNDNNAVIAPIPILCSGCHELEIGHAQWLEPEAERLEVRVEAFGGDAKRRDCQRGVNQISFSRSADCGL